MKITRRNALIGLGSVVVGSGALVGSGAFSSVEADRTVSVNTAGDSSAVLQLSGDGEYISDSPTDGVLTIDLGNGTGLNQDAVTTLDGVITITNNSPESESVDIGFADGSGGQTTSATVAPSSDTEVTFYIDADPDSGGTVTSAAGSVPSVSDGGSVEVDVEVDTTASPGTADDPAELTIVAEDPSPEDSS